MKGVTHSMVLQCILKVEYGFKLGHMGENRKAYGDTVMLLCRYSSAYTLGYRY